MIQSTLQSLGHDKRTMLLQLVRYAAAGLAITLLVAASYWAISEYLHIDPMISFTIVFLVFSAVSYFTHGAFSFKDHGARDRHHVRMFRFILVNLIGFAVNQAFIWVLVKKMGEPTWVSTIPIIFVTPLLTFALHRRFVYA